MIDTTKLPFIPARWFTPATGRKIDLIVIHDMECAEKGDSAESCAKFFQTLPPDRKASAHYCVDNNSIVHTVQECNVAYGAPGANSRGLHIEHAGWASQTPGQWSDDYSTAMLRLSAQLVAQLAKKYDVPVVWLTPSDVLAGKRGIVSHLNITRAGKLDPQSKYAQNSHTDPGDGFPISTYLGLVEAFS